MIDFVSAARSLRRSPRFALLVIGMLALGIGCTTAVFAAVDAVLFRSLPFHEPDRLVNVFGTNPSLEGGRSVLSAADFEVLKQSGAFESVAVAFTPAQGLGVKIGPEPELVRGTWMSAELLDTLGVKPLLGRGPGAEDARPEAEKTVVLGYDYWRRRFGKVSAIGSRLTVEGDPHTVIGVMPPGLRLPLRDPADVLATLQLTPATRQGPFYLEGTGRLRRDAAPAEVETALASAAAGLQERFPGGSDFHYLTPSMQDTAVAGARLGLLLLFGAVALVLLIVCANVGILMLARGQARARELAIRAALGASRRRLAGQLLAESAILATAGVALGLLVAAWATDALQALRPGSLPSARAIVIDGRGVVFAALVAVAACVLFGVLPALLTTRSLESLRESVGSSPRSQRARHVLVTAELALTLVLLVGAGLLGKSLLELERVRPGFRPEGVLSFQLNLPEARYADDKQVVAFYEELLHQIEGMPGVQAAAVTISVPPDWLVMSNDFFLPDRPPAAGEPAPVAPFIFVSPEYFRAVGVTLLDGRGFTPADRADAPPVVVISEAMARRYFGGDAIGKRVGIGPPGPDAALATVVGVVNDVKYRGLDSRDDAAMYAPFRQFTWRDMFVVVRAAGEPERLLGPVRRVLAGFDSDLAMREVRTLEDRMQRSVAEPRYRAVLLIAFGLVALVLAVLGVYGVMAHMVGRRQREIAIRMAVGGRPRDILRLVAVEAGALTLIGLVVGAGASIALGRLIGGLLFGVAPLDPIIYTAAAAVLLIGAALACYLPARRAMRVEPMAAMRGE